MTVKFNFPLLASISLVACVLTGCHSPTATPQSAKSAAPSTRINCYSLLHQLLEDEKKVSHLRFVKQEQNDVKKLVKKISANASAGAQLLEKFAKDDPSIRLNDARLPPGETATREAIAATKKRELLGQTGREFELTLLLSQAQALDYASHLAKVAAENEPHPSRARGLASLSEDMQNLHREVLVLLHQKPDGLRRTEPGKTPR